MISIKQDTEYMQNIVSASPVPPGKRFFSFSASRDNVGIISHGDDGNLYAVFGDNGEAKSINLKECNGKLWVAVATTSGSHSRLHIIHDIQPDQVGTYNPACIIDSDEPLPEIHDVHLSNFTRTVNGYTFPQIYLALQPWDRITKEDQLAYCNISPGSGGGLSVSLDRTRKLLAANPERILGVQFGKFGDKEGAFSLYETVRGKKKLQFRTFEEYPFTTETDASDGATSVASFQEVGSTVFVVAGDGLSLYDEDEYTDGDSEGILVTSTARHKITAVHTAQHGEDVVIWYQTKDNSVYYLRYQASSGRLADTMASCNPIRLLGPITNRVMSPVCCKTPEGNNLVKVLMTSDGNGNIFQHSQASDSLMWESQPLYASRGTINTELETMTIRLQLEGIELSNETSGNNKASTNISLFIESSAYMRVILNGRFASLDKAGQWFEADSTGVVNIMVPTSDLSSHNLYVTRVKEPGGKEHRINEPIVRPMDKILDRLAKYKTGQQLKNAKTLDGKPIVTSGQMTDKEAEEAVQIFSKLREAHDENKKKELRPRGASIAAEDPDAFTGVKVFRLESGDGGDDDQVDALAAQIDILEKDEDMALLLKYSRPESELNSAGDMSVMGWFPSPWEIIKWLGKKIKEIANKVGNTIKKWATELWQVAGGFWKLVVKWAGRAWEFVLDTAKAIGKALVWIFDQVKFGFNAIVQLIGLVANWGFVKDWSNSIGAFVNAGLDVADEKMADSICSILPDFLKKVENGSQQAAEKGPKDHDAAKKSSTPTNSASISQNWALDQFQHGGCLESLKDDRTSQGLNTANSNLDGISPLLTEAIDEIKTVLNALGDLAKAIGNDIWDLVRGKCSFVAFVKRVGKDIADFVLDALRNIATHIIDKISHAAQSLKNLLNRKIYLPIFSYLWEKLTGKDLTLLTLVSLLLGWPAAALHRASLGDRAIAPKWEGHLSKDNFEDLIHNRVPWADAARTVKPFFESLQLATSILDAITSFWDYTFDGVGLGAYSTEIGIINGAVAAINILVNLPLPSDRKDVPGIPHNIISYLNGSTAVVDLIFKVLKWKKVMTPAMARRFTTTWKTAVGLVIFGNEVFVEGWLITRHGRADRMYVGIQHEVFKLLGAGLSSVSAWTMDNQPQVALAAEVGKLGYTGIRTALQTLLIAYRNDSVNLTTVNDGSGVQVMIKGRNDVTQLMIPDRQWVTDVSGPEFAELVFGNGFPEKKQLELPILRKELGFPMLKKEAEVEVVED
ncbi:hypothetical protein Neosp_013517 [[Neocosmospora] mangrovei]